MWRNGRRNGLKIRWGAILVWVRVPPPVPTVNAEGFTLLHLLKNTPSFNKSFNTSLRVSLALNASLHAVKRGDGARPLPAVAMLISQLECVPFCFFPMENTPAIRSHKGRCVSRRRSVSGIRWTHLRVGGRTARDVRRARAYCGILLPWGSASLRRGRAD